MESDSLSIKAEVSRRPSGFALGSNGIVLCNGRAVTTKNVLKSFGCPMRVKVTLSDQSKAPMDLSLA